MANANRQNGNAEAKKPITRIGTRLSQTIRQSPLRNSQGISTAAAVTTRTTIRDTGPNSGAPMRMNR